MMIRDTLRLLRQNWKALLLFEVVLQLAGLLLFAPLIGSLIDLTMQLTGLRYLTRANLDLLLHSIWALPLLVVLALLAAFYMLIQIAGVTACITAGMQHRLLSPQELFRTILSSLSRSIYSGWFSLILNLLLLIPTIILSATSGVISSLGIPDLITYYISNPVLFFCIYFGLTLVCTLLCTPTIFALPIYVSRRCSFQTAKKHSLRQTKTHRTRIFCGLVVWNLLYMAILLLVLLLVTGCSIFLIERLGGSVTYEKMPLRILRYILLGIIFVFSSSAVPCFCSAVIAYYHQFGAAEPLTEHVMTQALPYPPYFRRNRKLFRSLCLAVASVLLLTNTIYLYRTYSGTASLRFVISVDPKIIAHRGYSAKAPENTWYAFSAAIEAGADGIELDIQQTADGVPVIAHDNNLKRISGWNQDISKTTYQALRYLDVGSWFGKDFSDARLMTLEELLQAVDDTVFLNIELKAETTSVTLERKVADLILEYNAANHCCITSFSYPALKRIKEYAPAIRTGFTMSYAYGNFYTLEAADAFSIKSMFITEQMVSLAHENGKEIYAWTVNSALEVQRMVNLGADHIITDQPKMAQKQLLRSSTEDTLFSAVMRLIS